MTVDYIIIIQHCCAGYLLYIWAVSPPEPLYQTYRATVIHKEIKRQTVCRNISKTSVDFSVDVSSLRLGNGTGIGRSSPLPSPAQSTLWQDLAAVRDSGVLETLTSDQCKYQEVRDLKRGEVGKINEARRREMGDAESSSKSGLKAIVVFYMNLILSCCITYCCKLISAHIINHKSTTATTFQHFSTGADHLETYES